MPDRETFPEVFARLRDILRPHASALVVTKDGMEGYSLDAPASAQHPQGLFFGAARIGKGYVSYYLMPIYVCPELLETLSDRLKKRMQGKSCFNFTAVDEAAFVELTELTAAGLAAYRERGFV